MEELQRSFGRLEAKVDALIMEVRTANQSHETTGERLDVRVKSLERWRIYLTAFAAGSTATIGLLFSILWRLLR